MKFRKNLLTLSLAVSFLTLNACGRTTGMNTPVYPTQQMVQSESFRKIQKVPDNGNINIRMDNEILSRRTFNNAPPRYLVDGKEAYPAIREVINSAQKSLYIELFLFHDDIVGREMAQLLVSKKRQGVDVKVLIDGLGLQVRKGDSRIFDYLKSQGIDVRKFNKTFLGKTGINITHRKLIIADGERGITGGMNFGDEYEHVWHDSMTLFEGEVVQTMQNEFLVDWQKSGGKKPEFIPALTPAKVYGNTPMRVVVTTAFESKKRYELRESMMIAINAAKEKIAIAGAYVSDDEMVKGLINASKRGVDVTVVMPKSGDSKIYNILNIGTAKKLIENNVNVFFYQPRFSHIKTYLFDNMVMVGSGNTDARSFRENQELNIIVEDAAFQADVENRLFRADIAQSKKAGPEDVKVGFFKKILIGALEVLDYYL